MNMKNMPISYATNTKYRVFSAFTGVGGFELGIPDNWKLVGMSEIDRHANYILRYRFNGVMNYGDIEKIKYGDLPDFDVLVGGSPCQDVSLAGKREGLAGVRSRLFFSYVSILKAKHPDYFIFENVKGLLSSNGGWDFAEVIDNLSEAGYNLWWQVLNSKDFGIPQNRERVFIVGAIRGKSIREIFFEAEEARENIENASFVKIVASRGRMKGGKWKQHMEYRTGATNTLTSAKKDNMLDINGRIRYLTPVECERLMGWPDDWTRYGIDDNGDITEISDNIRYKLIGNGVIPQVVSDVVRIAGL